MTKKGSKTNFMSPFGYVLVVVLAPFALLFSLARLPNAKKRIAKLNQHIATDWIKRGKLVYVGVSSNFALDDFAKAKLIPQFKDVITYDRWNEKAGEWEQNEPDNYKRVTTIWQDIVGDFDGYPMLILFIVDTNNPKISADSSNLYVFNEAHEGYVELKGKFYTIEQAKDLILAKLAVISR